MRFLLPRNVFQIKTFLNNYFREKQKKKKFEKALDTVEWRRQGREEKFFLEKTMKIA